MKKKKIKKPTLFDKDEAKFWIFAIPSLFVLMLLMYFGLTKVSMENSRVCTFMGKLWVSLADATDDKPEGCYTYIQLAEIKYEQSN